jgi:hypothetical protein
MFIFSNTNVDFYKQGVGGRGFNGERMNKGVSLSHI